MADPLQNAQFLAQLFQPVTDGIAGVNAAGVKVAQLGYQERLRQIKQQQDEADAERDFRYRQALTNLNIAGQERIAQTQTDRAIRSQELQTDRALKQQREMTDRAIELATAKELADAKKQYRLMAGAGAKAITEFGATAQEQLEGLNTEISRLNDAKAKSAANLYLRTQKALDEEMQRITTVTDKDEAVLVANGIGAITDKNAREKLAKLKGATDAASILSFLAPLFPNAAAEFNAGYEASKDAIINNRAKGSKVQALQRDLQYKATLLKDPSVLNYVATGLDESEPAPATPGAANRAVPLDNLFPKPPGAVAPVPAPAPPITPVAVPPPPAPPLFVGAPDQTGRLGNARRNDAVRDTLLAAGQGIRNFVSPSSWKSYYDEPGSLIPIPDHLVLDTPQETLVAQLQSRLRGMRDPASPRSADLRTQLYDLTSPAAYINSRPNYFTGGR